jgi:hypothetical protein
MVSITDNNETYIIGEVHYHSRFPREWAENHAEETGPEACGNCLTYGSLDGIFIGYCANCADYVYQGTRGRGLDENGVEFDSQGESIYDTYLSGLTLSRDAKKLVPIDNEDAMTMNEFLEHQSPRPEVYYMEIDEDELYNNQDLYVDYDDDDHSDIEVSVFDCHFEGGYNDM